MKLRRAIASGLLLGAVLTVPAAPIPLPPSNKSWATSVVPVQCGDWGTANWGKGRICWQGSLWWVTVDDTRSDGKCVYGVDDTSDRAVPIVKSCGVMTTSPKQSGYRWAQLTLGSPTSRYLTLDSTS